MAKTWQDSWRSAQQAKRRRVGRSALLAVAGGALAAVATVVGRALTGSGGTRPDDR